MTDTNYVGIPISLANNQISDDPTGGLFPEWPGIRVEYVDTSMVEDAAGHYQFTFTSLPSMMKTVKAVQMAFKEEPDGAWIRAGQQHSTSPFWITRPGDNPNGIGINDVPVTTHPNPKARTYEVIVVIEYTKENDSKHHTMVDPEIRNQPA